MGLLEVLRPTGRNQERSLRLAIDQAIDAIVSIDHQNHVTYFNKAAERLWGYRADEVIGQNVKMLVPGELRAGHDSLVEANRRTRVDKIVGTAREVQIQRKDGGRPWVALSLSRTETEAGVGYTAFLRDVSVERASRETIRQTLEQAIDAVVTIDKDNRVTFFNKAAEELWGYRADEVIGQNVKMLVPAAMQPHHDGFVNRNRTTGEDRIVGTSREVEVHRKDGTLRWGSLSLSRIKLDDGSQTYTAFLKDVTQQVEQRRQFELLSLVAGETDNSVIITNARQEIEYVNHGFERMTGYSFAEAAGKHPGKLLQGPGTDAMTVARVGDAVRAGRAFYEEILNYTKSGEPYWVSLAINAVRDSQGRIERYVSIQANVTETKQRALNFDIRLAAISAANAIAEWNVDGRLVARNHHVRSDNDLQAILGNDDVARLKSSGSLRREIPVARARRSGCLAGCGLHPACATSTGRSIGS